MLGSAFYAQLPFCSWPPGQVPLQPPPPIQPPPNLSRPPPNMRGNAYFRAPRGMPRGGYNHRGRGGNVPVVPVHPNVFGQQGVHFRKPYPKPWVPRPQFVVEQTSDGPQNGQTGQNDQSHKNGEGGKPNESGGHQQGNQNQFQQGGGGGGKKKRKNAKKHGGENAPQQQPSTRIWNREDAERALAVELAYRKKQNSNSLVIKFPDPELSRDIVKEFHCDIKSVHFQAPSNSRYCFIQLAEEADCDKVLNDLNKVKFGNGFLVAERKSIKDDEYTTPESIDPYTLYVGNLPSTITTAVVKEHFPEATRTDIGYAKKMKHTRYAFVKFPTVDVAIEAFQRSTNLTISSRSVILKFKRPNGAVQPPGEKPAKLTPEEKALREEKIKARAEKEKERREKEQEKKEKEKEKEKIKVEKEEEDEVEEEDDEVSEDDAEEEDDDGDDDDVDDDADDGEEDDDDDDDDDDDELVNADDDDDDDDDDDEETNMDEVYESDVNDDFSDMFYKLDGDIDNLNFSSGEYF